MPECEFVEICDPHRLACQGDLKDCPMVEFIHDYEDSPQFKKQYANREELVEAKDHMDKMSGWVKRATASIRQSVKELHDEDKRHREELNLQPCWDCDTLLTRIHEETYQIETDVSTGSRRANAIIDNTPNKEKEILKHGLEE